MCIHIYKCVYIYIHIHIQTSTHTDVITLVLDVIAINIGKVDGWKGKSTLNDDQYVI